MSHAGLIDLASDDMGNGGAVLVSLFEPVIKRRNGIGEGTAALSAVFSRRTSGETAASSPVAPRALITAGRTSTRSTSGTRAAGHVRVFNRAEGLDGREGEVRIHRLGRSGQRLDRSAGAQPAE